MWNEICRTTVIGYHQKPRDFSYYSLPYLTHGQCSGGMHKNYYFAQSM